jgi:hypothetical protein
MTIKLFPKQTAEMKAEEQRGLRDGGFEMLYNRPSQIWREYRKVYGNPESQWHEAGLKVKTEDLIETVLLMLFTLGRHYVFEICGRDGRAWLRGNGTILLERVVWP